MLRSMNELQGYVLDASDGEMGRCKDFLFDDRHWVVRYMVADTGKWLPGREVLISPLSLETPLWSERKLPVALTRKQVEEAPGPGMDEPVSKQYEEALTTPMTHMPFWGATGVWGHFVTRKTPPGEGAPDQNADDGGVAVATAEEGDPHLRSAQEVVKYHIHAIDDEVGHVKDFLVDDDAWVVRYMVVDTRNWLPGRQVLISPPWVDRFDWKQNAAHVELTRSQIEASPAYLPGAPTNRTYERRLHEHYGLTGYWL